MLKVIKKNYLFNNQISFLANKKNKNQLKNLIKHNLFLHMKLQMIRNAFINQKQDNFLFTCGEQEIEVYRKEQIVMIRTRNHS